MLQSKEVIGSLDRKISIQRPIYAINSVSDAKDITGWEEVAEVWAKIDDRQGSEVYESDQIVAVRGTIFTIRAREIDVRWRISFDGEYYNIEGIERPDRNRFIKVLAYIGQHYKEAIT
jgi:SPP1 family predicted phage head-tail adaptor